MTASHYLNELGKALTSRDGISKPRPQKFIEADVYANAATAHALNRIATASETTTDRLTTTTEWPAGVTARLVTRIGMRLADPTATVDITTHPARGMLPARLSAACQPCGWTQDRDDNHNKVLDKAQDHADQCTALPKPTAA